MRKELRKGKVLIDWSQNEDCCTRRPSVYTRYVPRPSPGSQLPLQWKEVEAVVKNKKIEALCFTPDDVRRRIKKHGDLFEPVLKLRQNL